jgi:hypothetical protein
VVLMITHTLLFNRILYLTFRENWDGKRFIWINLYVWIVASRVS